MFRTIFQWAKNMTGQLKEWILVAAAALLGAIFGAHELYDPDLGWNLAGGLTILRGLRVPTVDEFGVGRSLWIDYCWLPQLLFAGVYKLTGFSGLLVLQVFFSSLCGALFALAILPGKNAANQVGQQELERNDIALRTILNVGAGMLFLAPICHLRPQLVSFSLFLAFLLWRQSERKLVYLFAIQILWVNTHVYWVFAPGILLLDLLLAKQSIKPLLLSTLLSVVSPYGIQNLVVIFEYAFDHSHAHSLIREFQPLYSTEGYLFPLAAVTLLLALAFKRTLLNRVTSLGFFVLALSQMKFTPLFGATSLATRVGDKGRPQISRLSPVLVGTIIVGLVSLLTLESPLRNEEREILQTAASLLSKAESGASVANSFNEGGWLALGLLGSGMRTTIDGRTLVMGKDRLNRYAALMKNELTVCEYLGNAEFAFLRSNGKTLRRLQAEPCFEDWQIIEKSERFSTLRRKSLTRG